MNSKAKYNKSIMNNFLRPFVLILQRPVGLKTIKHEQSLATYCDIEFSLTKFHELNLISMIAVKISQPL